MNKECLKALRTIPPMNELLNQAEVVTLAETLGKALVDEVLTEVIAAYREQLMEDDSFASTMACLEREDISFYLIHKLREKIQERQKKSLIKVVNATGIVLHTNLGRAPLPDRAIDLIREVNEGYSNLEYNLETGTRGSRHSHIDHLIAHITGAESAMVVNNNAAAVFLSLNTLAKGKEVIVSRGQLVEIGGSFRIPDIIASSGCHMVEVGTTNKTKKQDYLRAITENTSVLLKVHTSNYKISGFTEEVPLPDLVAMGREHNLLVMEDLGSGCLFDLSQIGLPHEPTVAEVISSGVDLVTFSGDKLLGGPQIGVIAGRREIIEEIKKNPLARIVRCDKSSIAALTAVLEIYREPEKALEQVPALKMLALSETELLQKAQELESQIKTALGELCQTEIVEVQDEAGGGSLPDVLFNGKALAITLEGLSANRLQELLRKGPVPIICRIVKDRVLLNVRTITERDYPIITQRLVSISKVK